MLAGVSGTGVLPFAMKVEGFLGSSGPMEKWCLEFLNMHKGLHFDLKVASYYFTILAFLSF